MIKKTINSQIAILIFLAIFFSISFLIYKDFGATIDEFIVYTRGDYFYHKVVGNDPYLQKGFVVNDSDNFVLHYYNSTYPALLYIINNDGSYETYHLLNIIFASFSFVAVYEMLLLTYKKWQYAILGPIFLFFTPRFLGHIPANPKDIPFATCYLIVLLLILYHKKFQSLLSILLIGLFIGLTASLRVLGFGLIFIYLIYILLESRNEKNFLKKFPDNIYSFFLVSFISFSVLMMSIPYIGADPFNHTLELLKINKSYPWEGVSLLFGMKYTKENFSINYVPIWIAISTPISILLLSIRSIGNSFKNISKLKKILLISLAVQIIFLMVIKPFVYNGIRHYLFIFPQLGILAVIGLIELTKWRKIFVVVCLLIFIDFGIIAYQYIKIHPYQYVYFNIFGSLNRDVTRDFDFDYWASSDRKSLEWLKKNTKIENPKIYMCSASTSLKTYFPEAIDSNNNPYKGYEPQKLYHHLV